MELTNSGTEERREKTCRRKIVYVPCDFVRDLLTRGLTRGPCLNIPEPVGLPETARTMGVWYDASRNSFAFVVEDESFEETPEGCEFPVHEVQWRTVVFAIKEDAS